jgi:hypothetical protein
VCIGPFLLILISQQYRRERGGGGTFPAQVIDEPIQGYHWGRLCRALLKINLTRTIFRCIIWLGKKSCVLQSGILRSRRITEEENKGYVAFKLNFMDRLGGGGDGGGGVTLPPSTEVPGIVNLFRRTANDSHPGVRYDNPI